MLTPLEPWISAKIGRDGRPLDREGLGAYQLAKLNKTLRLAQEQSHFYRRTLGDQPLVLRSLGELARLPFCSADDLRAAPLDFLCVPQDSVERIVTLPTSGTTGPPKRLYFTAADQELTRDFFHHGMSTFVGPGDRVLVLLPGSRPGSVGALLAEGLARMDVLVIPHGPVVDPRETLAVLERERATSLVGIPVQVLALARVAAGEADRGAYALRSVLLSTDRMPRAVAAVIAGVFGCEVYDHYGMTEMGLGGGVDCRARAGYHLREADLLFEIVDPDTGKPVPEGVEGEVVFTTLTRQAMPLVRYRTGDVSRFIPGPCPCGTVLKRLAHVDERLAGGLVLVGGEKLRQADLDEALFSLQGVADFKVAAVRESGRICLTVAVKAVNGTPPRESATNALLGIPALAREAAEGHLLLEVTGWPAGAGSGTGTEKRRIVQLGGSR
jgi:phenylacetate-CoA ligase